MGGMIRNIESVSDASSTFDMQFKYAVAGGFGAWRVVTEFQGDHSFDQETSDSQDRNSSPSCFPVPQGAWRAAAWFCGPR